MYRRIREDLVAGEAQMAAENKESLSPLDRTLASIPNFAKSDFYNRCAKAFEMILKALAANDEDTLKMLLNKKLFAKFQEIIRQRQNDGITAETDLIRIEDMKIEQAEVSPKGLAHIVVRFVSEQVNLLKNAAGEVIEGDENFVQKITDVWTFERNLNLKSPAWLLASTRKNEE
jgi:predicted lipid-binding transport protein (Tim44 family)